MIPGSSYSSLTQLPRHHSHCGFISPAVFFSDLEFKRTTNLGVAAAGNKTGRLDPVRSATGLGALLTSPYRVPGEEHSRFWFCCPQRPVRPINSGSRKGQASSGPSKGRGQPSLIRVLKMFLRKPIQMSSALQGRAGIIRIKQRLHGDFIFKALWGWLGRGGSGVAQRIPSWEVTPLPPKPALGWFQVYSCDCLQGKQRALDATISDSSGLHSVSALPGREHTWGLSYSLEKRL